MQLQQRIITSGPIENLRPPPLFTSPRSLEEKPPIPQARQITGHPNGYPPIDSPTQANTYPPFSPYEGRSGYPQPSSPMQHSNYSPQSSTSGQHDGQLTGRQQQAILYQSVHQPPQSHPIQFNGHSQQQRLPLRDNGHHRRSPSSQAPQVIGQYQSAPEDFVTEFSNVSPAPSDGSWTLSPACQEWTPPGFAKNTVSESNGKNEKTEKSHFSSVTKLNIFGRKTRAASINATKSTSPQIQHAQASAVPNYLLPIALSEQPYDPAPSRKPSGPPPTPSSYTGSRFSSISASTATTQSSYEPPETPDFNPWAERGLNTDSSSTISRNISKGSSPAQTLRSSGSIRRAPINILNSSTTVSSKDLLPSETNKYAGFCKGAWKAQIGDRKKAMDERQRPGGMYNAARYWQCSKCKFEGRLVMLDKKTKAVDKRVLTAEGVQFRWDFLFKSHVETKDATSDFLKSTFGCMFCTAEGRGTPTFGGAQMLMAHLQEHRDRLPTGEVLYRMNCLVGPKAPLEDDFDINLIGKEGVQF